MKPVKLLLETRRTGITPSSAGRDQLKLARKQEGNIYQVSERYYPHYNWQIIKDWIMMALFGTEEWIKAFIENINKNEAYRKAASWWEGDFIFVARADGPLDHDLYIWIDLWHGTARDGRALESIDEVEAEYIYEGPYMNWVDVIKGTLDPIEGLMEGRFMLQGDINKVLQAVDAAKELVSTLAVTETDFY